MADNRLVKKRAIRRLRGYAFDPGLSLQLDTIDVNNIVFKVEWEPLAKHPTEPDQSILKGEYIEIIDYDPASRVFYPPANLDSLEVLLQDGLTPNVNNPQFHQQMVYAVVMATIKNFEKALGRKIQWAEHVNVRRTGENKAYATVFVERLRIYPHALRQANAFYHPDKKALLFGYFPAAPTSPMLQLPGSTIFTCLSHDIIAHETTHAILDGLHRRYIEPSHPDTRAFHEAFADIVALFQHFTFPEVLKHQIAKTRGDLNSQNLLGQLAQEFGKALGGYGSLRDAIGHFDKETNTWVPHQPHPGEYQTEFGFHKRGAILVGAIFEAFLNIYKRRIQSLLRIATGGSGILPAGNLHPDLVDKLSDTAAKIASHVLRICVRALDYCPPIDLTFGDYLRAIITADKDMVEEDDNDYRIAFIEAFQKRGVFPKGLKGMSVETLCYMDYPRMGTPNNLEEIFVKFLRDFKHELSYATGRKEIFNITKEFIIGGQNARMGLHQRIKLKLLEDSVVKRFSQITGLFFTRNPRDAAKHGFAFSSKQIKFQVGNLWLASRVSPDGNLVNHVVVTLLQKRGVRAELKDGKFVIKGYYVPGAGDPPDDGFIFRGGCTLIFDLDTLCLKYAIQKSITDVSRMEQQFRYANGLLAEDSTAATYFDEQSLSALTGAFGFIHAIHNH